MVVPEARKTAAREACPRRRECWKASGPAPVASPG